MFFFNDAATTEIYTLSLHDALPIYAAAEAAAFKAAALVTARGLRPAGLRTFADRDAADRARAVNTYHLVRHRRRPHVPDRKSTRLNSRPANISDAVFCLYQKKTRLT